MSFKHGLALNGIHLSERQIRKFLRTIPTYLQNVQKTKKIERRPYTVHGYGDLLQADLAAMPEYNGFHFIFVAVDFYIQFIHTKALKTKTAATILEELKYIFENYIKYDHMETDAG